MCYIRYYLCYMLLNSSSCDLYNYLLDSLVSSTFRFIPMLVLPAHSIYDNSDVFHLVNNMLSIFHPSIVHKKHTISLLSIWQMRLTNRSIMQSMVDENCKTLDMSANLHQSTINASCQKIMMHIVHIIHLRSMLSNANASYEWFRTASIMHAINNDFVIHQ